MIDVSVIIVNYNTKDLLVSCLSSIFSNTKDVSFEVIVFDNNSIDGSKELFSEYDYIHYIYWGKNLGYGKANNIASASASGEFVFFLNPDTVLKNNALKIMCDYYREHDGDNIGALGCYLDDGFGNSIHSYAKFKRISKTMIGKYRKSLRRMFFLDNLTFKLRRLAVKGSESGSKFVGYVTGAALFIRKSLYENIGGFDDDFFMYYEESEMQSRLMKKGYNRVVIDGPRITHYEGKSFEGKPSNLRRKMYAISEVLYVKKVHGIIAYIVYKYFYLFNVILDFIVDLYRFRYTPGENLEYFMAIYTGKV